MEKEMCHGAHFGGKKTYMLLGTVAFIYGLMVYAMTVYGWKDYTAWMVGGALLVVVGWVKKWMYMKMEK